MSDSIQHVVFLSASSGGGHNGTARAVAGWMERSGISAQIEIVDVYGGGLRLLPWMAVIRQHSNAVWRAFTAVMGWSPLLECCRAIMRPIVVRRCVRAIRQRPDVIVATHFTPGQFMREIAAHFDPPPRTITVASDYEPHRAWFGNADLTIVSDPLGVQRARMYGIATSRLLPVPLLPAGPSAQYVEDKPRGHRDSIRLCAVMGADGTSAGRLLAVLDGIERAARDAVGAPPRFRVDVICGRNRRLRGRIMARASVYEYVHVNAVGFVDDVPTRLAAADIALLRASPLVLTEAAGQGVPILAFDWHSHESAAVSLLAQWGSGYASRRPADIATIALHWARNPDELAIIRRNAGCVARTRFDERTVETMLPRSRPAQRPQRIDPARPPGWNPHGEQRDHREQHRHPDEHERIAGVHAE